MQYELAGSFTIRFVNFAAAASSFDLKIRQNLASVPAQNSDISANANALCLKSETDEVRRG
ncbi:hypothetical protein [uncultured Campylobacter sp.]|uniref:hypothetical protein n=1 Tax=uncultured Campylobacter sp. TaxID=218934 RepID=UPI002627AFF0|nr:hypothetical protein [uncultured Campylobacter sp.]